MCLLRLACFFGEPKQQQNLKYIPYTKLSRWQKIWVRWHFSGFWFCGIFRKFLHKDRGEPRGKGGSGLRTSVSRVSSGLFQWQRSASPGWGVCRCGVFTDFVGSDRLSMSEVGGAARKLPGRATFGQCCSSSVGMFLEEEIVISGHSSSSKWPNGALSHSSQNRGFFTTEFLFFFFF